MYVRQSSPVIVFCMVGSYITDALAAMGGISHTLSIPTGSSAIPVEIQLVNPTKGRKSCLEGRGFVFYPCCAHRNHYPNNNQGSVQNDAVQNDAGHGTRLWPCLAFCNPVASASQRVPKRRLLSHGGGDRHVEPRIHMISGGLEYGIVCSQGVNGNANGTAISS